MNELFDEIMQTKIGYEDAILIKALELFNNAMEVEGEKEVKYILKQVVEYMGNHFDVQENEEIMNQQSIKEETKNENYFWLEFIKWIG